MEEPNPELESFRRQWRAEVTARKRNARGNTSSVADTGHNRRTPERSAKQIVTSPVRQVAVPSAASIGPKVDDDDGTSRAYHDLPNKEHGLKLGDGSEPRVNPTPSDKEPTSALEHYERAVEKETQGVLGDSLKHYRQAFRLDSDVDRTYTRKHFPPHTRSKKSLVTSSSTAAFQSKPSSKDPQSTETVSATSLIDTFSSLAIHPSEPPTSESPPPPCPISALPQELLAEVLLHLAVADVAAFARLSSVCKPFAYLFATEERVWKRVAEGREFGFTAMHYAFACPIPGDPPLNKGHTLHDSSPHPPSLPRSLSLTPTYPTYYASFRSRPRIRFNGLYISTVNYLRPGASSPNQLTWNTPVHIVTYYRYLRFFRDGTLLSLLTTNEPSDVVHHLSKETCELHERGGGHGLPSIVVKGALKGRWRLSGNPFHDPHAPSRQNTSPSTILTQADLLSPTLLTAEDPDEPEGNLHIETQGVDPKYMYKMHLALSSVSASPAMTASGKPKNTKLQWRGFWSYNRLTDDWAEFGMRGYKPFFWSRVKSYGMGGD
ncbi:MAG: hypothetical protein M1817_002167 [Caeruleum heppii]|nr:MAG: hypothetical protein M1817_002167 [Caeruleum heppii]